MEPGVLRDAPGGGAGAPVGSLTAVSAAAAPAQLRWSRRLAQVVEHRPVVGAAFADRRPLGQLLCHPAQPVEVVARAATGQVLILRGLSWR